MPVFNIPIISLVLGAALWLATAAPATAQQRFRGGVVAGFNLSQLDGDRLSGFNQIGFNAGGRVAAVLSPRWQLSLELLYSQQGSSRTRYDDPGAALDRVRLNMVEAPVMINFREWKFDISGGLSYGRLIDYRVEDVFGVDVTDTQQYRDNLLFVIFSATFYFRDNLGLNVGWSKALTDLQARSGPGALIGRNIQVRGVYLF